MLNDVPANTARSMTNSGLVIQENVPLAPMTTFGIGGPARFFVRAASADDLVSSLDFAAQRRLKVFILGGGSNLLVADRGFDGLVVKVELAGIGLGEEADANVEVTAAAGEDWDAFVAFCVSRDLAGVECLSGIPGLVGGTPIQNVGAYGQEVSQTVKTVKALDRTDNSIRTLANAECGFAYRSSIFNTSAAGRYVVLAVTFSLTKGGRAFIGYRDLAEHFKGVEPTLAETREAVLKIRRSKSMVIDPADVNSHSAGSFFKNPVVAKDVYSRIAGEFDSNVPSYPVDDTHVKLPAAWLIEHAGFAKGYSRGRAGISSNHTLALVNLGGAAAAEIVDLQTEIRERVQERFGIELRPEPNFIGFG